MWRLVCMLVGHDWRKRFVISGEWGILVDECVRCLERL